MKLTHSDQSAYRSNIESVRFENSTVYRLLDSGTSLLPTQKISFTRRFSWKNTSHLRIAAPESSQLLSMPKMKDLRDWPIRERTKRWWPLNRSLRNIFCSQGETLKANKSQLENNNLCRYTWFANQPQSVPPKKYCNVYIPFKIKSESYVENLKTCHL